MHDVCIAGCAMGAAPLRQEGWLTWRQSRCGTSARCQELLPAVTLLYECRRDAVYGLQKLTWAALRGSYVTPSIRDFVSSVTTFFTAAILNRKPCKS